MNSKFRSIRARVTALFALLVALLMGASGNAVHQHEIRRAEKRAHEILEVAAERAIDELNEDESANRTLLQVVRADDNEIAAGGLSLLVVENERTVWRSQRHAPSWPSVGRNWRVKTVHKNGQILVLASDWQPVAEGLGETARTLWLLGAIMVGATTLGTWIVVGRTLSPLDQLAAQAQNASIESLAVRLQAPSSDAEMLHLTRTLNDLLGRLEREAQARGRFYAAASHELRTPIQVLLGEIEVTLSRPRSGPFYREAIGQLYGETSRLKSLVQDLLQLNALEMRQLQATSEPLDLKQWTQRALSQQSQAIERKSLRLQTCLDEAGIEAPPAHLEMLLRNVLENAVKYAPPGGAIKVELRSKSAGAQLRIWNACDVPEDSNLSNWFEPFYRPDEARDLQTGGNGLGLSIVAALARANGWQVELCAESNGVAAHIWIARRSFH